MTTVRLRSPHYGLSLGGSQTRGLSQITIQSLEEQREPFQTIIGLPPSLAPSLKMAVLEIIQSRLEDFEGVPTDKDLHTMVIVSPHSLATYLEACLQQVIN